MSAFELVTRYTPAGDQPEAIRQLVEGLQAGLSHLTLLCKSSCSAPILRCWPKAAWSQPSPSAVPAP